MQTTAVTILALVAAVFAIPSPGGHGCTPATYSCTVGGKGWRVCNTSGEWVIGGDCPPKTHCEFNEENGSPYCIPGLPEPVTPGSCTPGTYACAGPKAWRVCNTEHQWVYAGSCPPKTHCEFNEENGSPYCV